MSSSIKSKLFLLLIFKMLIHFLKILLRKCTHSVIKLSDYFFGKLNHKLKKKRMRYNQNGKERERELNVMTENLLPYFDHLLMWQFLKTQK